MPRPSDPLARTKLLAAAEAEFVEHGLDGSKVEQIAKRAGMSKGAFYLHFPGKAQLFRELVEGFVARLAALTDASLHRYEAHDACSAEELIDRWVSEDVAVFEFIWQNRGLIRRLLEGGSGARFRYLVDEFLERFSSKSRHVLQQGVLRGIFREDLDFDLAASFIAGAYDRLARDIVRQSTRPDLRPLLEDVQRLVLFGLASAQLRESASPRPSGAEPAPPSGVRAPRPLPDDPVSVLASQLRSPLQGRSRGLR